MLTINRSIISTSIYELQGITVLKRLAVPKELRRGVHLPYVGLEPVSG